MKRVCNQHRCTKSITNRKCFRYLFSYDDMKGCDDKERDWYSKCMDSSFWKTESKPYTYCCELMGDQRFSYPSQCKWCDGNSQLRSTKISIKMVNNMFNKYRFFVVLLDKKFYLWRSYFDECKFCCYKKSVNKDNKKGNKPRGHALW